MAPFMFTKKIVEGESIEVFNHGKQKRDFTYVSDIVSGCVGVLGKPQGYNVLNLGNGTALSLGDFISTIESVLGVEAKKEYRDAQPGDVSHTHADIRKAHALFGYQPSVGIVEGMKEFVSWYKDFYTRP
jgi:UDP-glucuronate 4-epimerase